MEGRQVFEAVTRLIAIHCFFISESDASRSILVAVRRDLSAFVTQRDTLQSGVDSLRPGMLATIGFADDIFSFLFLHKKADHEPRSWGLRDDMTMHILRLKRVLDKKSATGRANLIVTGDFNNVGMNLTYSTRDFSPAEEPMRYSDRFRRAGCLYSRLFTSCGAGGKASRNLSTHSLRKEARNLVVSVLGFFEVNKVARVWNWFEVQVGKVVAEIVGPFGRHDLVFVASTDTRRHRKLCRFSGILAPAWRPVRSQRAGPNRTALDILGLHKVIHPRVDVLFGEGLRIMRPMSEEVGEVWFAGLPQFAD